MEKQTQSWQETHGFGWGAILWVAFGTAATLFVVIRSIAG